ncbi:MAG: hypothetical protein ACOCT0_02545, partial [Halobacteriota archaeon]
MSLKRYFEYSVVCLLTASIIGYGLLSGLKMSSVFIETPLVDLRLVFLNSIRSTLAFGVFISFFGLLLVKEVYSRSEIPVETDGGPLLAIVPVYNEAEILHKSVESLKRS